jgi:hypothetical protein
LAFEHLSNEIDRLYLDVTENLFANPWELRNRYIHVLLGEIKFENLVNQMSTAPLTDQQLRRVHLLLEAQRERPRMYTSCGWFFEDFDRIEPKNNVAYAAQAVWLVRLATGIDLEADMLIYLKQVKSAATGLSADMIFQDHLQRAEELFRQNKQGKVGFAN